ncbi:unnamed protein product [Brugia pahangi]|uniref:ShKT domain-containing protein n=1 Tax=Brugia pahangi TaxID=6280 RepID=A0A0N4T5U5_BRUPA|nr:unnamed protein product [Brugia pahangi]
MPAKHMSTTHPQTYTHTHTHTHTPNINKLDDPRATHRDSNNARREGCCAAGECPAAPCIDRLCLRQGHTPYYQCTLLCTFCRSLPVCTSSEGSREFLDGTTLPQKWIVPFPSQQPQQPTTTTILHPNTIIMCLRARPHTHIDYGDDIVACLLAGTRSIHCTHTHTYILCMLFMTVMSQKLDWSRSEIYRFKRRVIYTNQKSRWIAGSYRVPPSHRCLADLKLGLPAVIRVSCPLSIPLRN